MNTPALPRWPFRLAVAATIILVAGTAVLLFGITALPSEALYRVRPWQYGIARAILCTPAALALVALWAGVRSLRQYPNIRTPWNYGCLCLAGLSLILVTALASIWTIVMTALLTFSEDGGWAAFGANPTATGIVGTVTSPNGLIQSYPFIDSSGSLRMGAVTRPNGCFVVHSSPAIDFGVYAPGYQRLKVPVGKGYFRVAVSLSPMGAPEPTKVTWRRISALQFIGGLNACAEIHG
jgi:hypothetical protein